MQHYVGLDVSVKETSVCIIDKAGKVIREVKVATEPVAILAVLTEGALAIERIGLEAGPLSQWLYSALAEAGLPVICVETRHMKAALSAQINKSDRNDARGIAQMMRVGLYRPVHAADQSAAFAGQGPRHRERSAWHAAQFRPQGWHGGDGQVRGSNSRAGCGPSGLGRDRRTVTDRPPGPARAARRASPPTA